MSLLAELKRRNVFRMAGLYTVGAWLIVQVGETVLPAFDTPDWVLRAIIILLAIGFIPAVVVSWLFELTPEGVKRDVDVNSDVKDDFKAKVDAEFDDDIDPERSSTSTSTRRRDRRLDLLMVVGVLALFALLMAEWFWPASPDLTSRPLASTEAVAAGQASIAVLPFVNMSPDQDNEYFADGISEELLNVLVGVDGLKVASRASAFIFKDSATPIPEIARLLNVDHVLEGSVRKQGERVRITAQLIHAASDAQLWSQTYERDLTDIFRLQEEIAQAITQALENALGVRRVSVAAVTPDLVAYEHYLRGRTRFYQRIELDAAIDDLEIAVERDPVFADAWAFLSAVNHVASSGWPTERDRDALRARAPLAADRALSLDPESAIALAVKGDWSFRSGDPDQMIEGLRLLEKSADLSPVDTSARLWLGLSWLDLGFAERALPHLIKAHELDPLVPSNNGYLGLTYATLGRPSDQARDLMLRAVEISGTPFWAVVLATGMVNADETEAAIDLLTATKPHISGDGSEFIDRVLSVLNNPEMRDQFLANNVEAATAGLSLEMLAALMFKDSDTVFFNTGPQASYEFMTSTTWLPSLRWVHEDPRFYALMDYRGIVALWQQQGFPPGCRPVEGADHEPSGNHLDCSGDQQ